MSLICLNCQSLVYRVSRPSALDGEERAGPVIPTEEWVEKDVLKTSTGVVEVYKGCLVRSNSKYNGRHVYIIHFLMTRTDTGNYCPGGVKPVVLHYFSHRFTLR